ncbi:MAG: AzlC family ABC transporter permease, partial [Dehalococcoidia bacterium]
GGGCMAIELGSESAAIGHAAEFRRGFVAIMPLWVGVVPFGATFAIVARGGGFSAVETMALSMLVFAGSAQLAVVTLAMSGAAAPAIVLTTFILNLRHVLYAVSLRGYLGRQIHPPRWLLAFFLTDESYGVTMRDFLERRGSAVFLLGASLSLYLCFVAATLVGTLLGRLGPDPERIGLDFVFTLSFLALLLPLLRTWRQVAVAALAALLALGVRPLVDGGSTILLATIIAAGAGSLLDGRRERT